MGTCSYGAVPDTANFFSSEHPKQRVAIPHPGTQNSYLVRIGGIIHEGKKKKGSPIVYRRQLHKRLPNSSSDC